MTDLEFCEWVRLRADATNGELAIVRRLIEATERLAKSAVEVQRLRANLATCGSIIATLCAELRDGDERQQQIAREAMEAMKRKTAHDN